MRRVFLILIVAIYAYSNSLSYDEIAQMVEKIKQKKRRDWSRRVKWNS
jgi:hypothetical protein